MKFLKKIVLASKKKKKLFLLTVLWKDGDEEPSEYEAEGESKEEALKTFWQDSDIKKIKEQVGSVDAEEIPWKPKRVGMPRF